MNNELYHHGIKGQRWGVRRYENKDGTLTPAGKKRYADDANTARESANEWDEMAKIASSKGKNKRAAKYAKYAAQERAEASEYERRIKESSGNKKSTKQSKSNGSKSTTKTVNKGKKMVQSGVQVTGKAVGYGAKVALDLAQRSIMLQNINHVMDDLYR